MIGMDKHTGKRIDGLDELRQGVADVLATPLNSLPHHRDYGSRLFQLIDGPVDQRFLVEIYQAVAEALYRWRPDFGLQRVELAEVRVNGPVFNLYGFDKGTGEPVVLEGV